MGVWVRVPLLPPIMSIRFPYLPSINSVLELMNPAPMRELTDIDREIAERFDVKAALDKALKERDSMPDDSQLVTGPAPS